MKKIYLIGTIILMFFVELSLAQTILSGTLACNASLHLNASPYQVTSNLTILPGCSLSVDPGVEIKMDEGTHIIVKGKVNFSGTASQPIHIHATDTIWGNIMLDSTLAQKSTFNYVTIENARKSVKPGQEPGSIYGYYSAMDITNCHFKNNLRCVSNYKCPQFLIKDCILDSTNVGEKIHGQYCNGAVVDGNTLFPTHGDNDGIDFDASNNITIANNFVYRTGDDAIDIGQCDSIGCDTVLIHGNYLLNMFNKGVSNGEYCMNININHNVIIGCQMGIGAKSGAHVVADHNTLYKNSVGVDSYQHLDQIWGPGHLTVSNCIIAGSDTTFKVDPTAFLSVSYSLADDTIIPGTGNIKGNPSFISPAVTNTANFHLNTNSAAINSGDPSFALDPDATRTDMGAFYSGLTAIQSNFLSNVLKIYPNPTNGTFHIRFQDNSFFGNTSHVQLKIFNTAGLTVYSENILLDPFKDNYNIDFSKQARGVYYWQIISDQKILTDKLIIN